MIDGIVEVTQYTKYVINKKVAKEHLILTCSYIMAIEEVRDIYIK
jgi:hypothetical protein